MTHEPPPLIAFKGTLHTPAAPGPPGYSTPALYRVTLCGGPYDGETSLTSNGIVYIQQSRYVPNEAGEVTYDPDFRS